MKTKRITTCLSCDQPFAVAVSDLNRGRGKYCSVACRHKGLVRTADVDCPTCGVSIKTTPAKKSRGWVKYCSRDCYYKSLVRQESVPCAYCGEKFQLTPSAKNRGHKFCSKECRLLATSGENSKYYKKSTVKSCARCGSEFAAKPYRSETAKFCSWDCNLKSLGEKQRGERNPSWAGGGGAVGAAQRRRSRIRGLPYTLTEQEWEDILLYFGRACAYCGERDTKLAQDHVIPVTQGGGYTKDNIVPACKTCNSKKNAKTPAQAGMGFYIWSEIT